MAQKHNNIFGNLNSVTFLTNANFSSVGFKTYSLSVYSLGYALKIYTNAVGRNEAGGVIRVKRAHIDSLVL